MKVKQLSEVELELLSLQDLAELIIEENKKTLSTADIFKKICELKGLSDEVYSSKIGDFYTSLMTDKRFIMLEDATWDLKKKHVAPTISLDEDEIDESEETEIDEDDEILDEESVEQKLEIEDDEIDTGMDDESDLADLSIVEEEELED